jgi:hypothetical protein
VGIGRLTGASRLLAVSVTATPVAGVGVAGVTDVTGIDTTGAVM